METIVNILVALLVTAYVKAYPHSQNATTNITSLVQQQTDVIKKLVANHKLDYPVVTRNEPIEELKQKCQHLERHLTTTTPPTTTTTITQPSGFYVTHPASTTQRPAPVKYINLEPVILQKTILSDGRTIYYWHRTIPSLISPTTTTTTPPTTTTTSYNFRNFFPFYSSGGAEQSTVATTEKTPTENQQQFYEQQLKFVVPVPYLPMEEGAVMKPWDIDQFAYYPKHIQPENVNLQVPYVPTFHVIKSVKVPQD